jgi:hypothetical protein
VAYARDKTWTSCELLFIISTMSFFLKIMRKLKLLNVIFYGIVVIF